MDLGHSKLYATLDIGAARVARTRQVEFHPQNPVWNESFRVYVAHSSPNVTLSVKNQLPVSAQVLGRATIATSRLLSGEPVKERFELYSEHGYKLHEYVYMIIVHCIGTIVFCCLYQYHCTNNFFPSFFLSFFYI